MTRKTTTTTTIQSKKDSDGDWQEYHRKTVTVVERDDEGYPYGPVVQYSQPPFKFPNPYGYGEYFSWGQGTGRSKRREDGQDG